MSQEDVGPREVVDHFGRVAIIRDSVEEHDKVIRNLRAQGIWVDIVERDRVARCPEYDHHQIQKFVRDGETLGLGRKLTADEEALISEITSP